MGESKQMKFKADASCVTDVGNIAGTQKRLIEGLENAFGEMIWQRGFGRFQGAV